MVGEPKEPAGLAAHDGRQRHCPMLGHGVGFSYCRAPGESSLCPKILDCWFEAFDIEGFVRAHWSEAQIARLSAPKTDRLVTVLEAVARAKSTSK